MNKLLKDMLVKSILGDSHIARVGANLDLDLELDMDIDLDIMDTGIIDIESIIGGF